MSNPYHRPAPYHGSPPQNPYPGAPQGYGYGYPQPSPPTQGYGYPQVPYGGGNGVPTGAQNNPAMVSVVFGFISIVGSFLCSLGLLGALGLGFGVAGLKKSKETGTGRNVAIGGIVLSTLGLLIWVAMFTLILKKVP